MELTIEQQEIVERIMQKVETSKVGLMKCIICDNQTHDRGLICAGPTPPASTIICGLCYACKNLPGFETEIQRKVRDYVITIGREDLLLTSKEEEGEDE